MRHQPRLGLLLRKDLLLDKPLADSEPVIALNFDDLADLVVLDYGRARVQHALERLGDPLLVQIVIELFDSGDAPFALLDQAEVNLVGP